MIFFKKEKEVIEQVIKFVDIAQQCLSTAKKALDAYLEDNMSQAKGLSHKVDSLESEADLIRHGIRDKLYLGAYLPGLREDIYKMVESIDKVANAGEACCDFFLNQRPIIPDEMKSQFLAAIKKSLYIIEPLKEAVLCFLEKECSIEIVRDQSKEVGLIESEVDRIEWNLTKNIFTSSLEFSHKIHLKLCLDVIVEVSDRAEDAADQLELAAMKSIV